MMRVRLVLAAVLVFYCTTRVQAGDKSAEAEDTTAEPSKQNCSIKPVEYPRPLTTNSPSNLTMSLRYNYLYRGVCVGGYVVLTGYTEADKALDKNDCFKFMCDGTASPHKEIMWYRLLDPDNNSTGLLIRANFGANWSEGLDYEIKTQYG